MEQTVSTNLRRNQILLWGCIIGAIVYLISTIGRLGGLEGSKAWGAAAFLLQTGIVAFGMVKATKKFRDTALGGFISFNRAFSTAFLTGLVATAVVCLLTIIVLQFMGDKFRDEMERQKMEQIDKLEEEGASEDQIEMTEKIMDMFTSLPVIIATAIVMYTIGSAIVALIVAAVVKKESPENTFPA